MRFRKAYVLLTDQIGSYHALEKAISQAESVEVIGIDPIFEGLCKKFDIVYKAVSADTANYHPITLLMDQAWDWVDKETEKLAEHYLIHDKIIDIQAATLAAVQDMHDTVGLYIDGKDVVSFP